MLRSRGAKICNAETSDVIRCWSAKNCQASGGSDVEDCGKALDLREGSIGEASKETRLE